MEFNITDEMYKKSLVSKGDVSRILKLIDKAEKGEDITIVFLGGSITQGCHSTVYEKCYVELTYNWFKEKFKNANVKHINAGVGATGSLIGVHRAENQVISENPDIVFVDAAVNDDEDYSCKVAYESLIRKLLNSKSKPAVIEVFMTLDTGFNVQEQQVQIGERYNVPMISFRDTVKVEVDKNKIKFFDILTDEVHPNDIGHYIISQLLINLIEDVYKNDYIKGKDIKISDNILEIPCVFGDRYINGIILNNLKITPKVIKGFKNYDEGFQVFQNGWIFNEGENKDGKLTFELDAKNIVLLYKKSVSESAGKIRIIVNDKDKVLLNTYFKDGWGDYSATEILELSDETKKYKIEIEVVKENALKEITILGILVS
ncbi:SGNH/GDSL hydrolase family protein [Clostridium sp. C2-6-12]|uniref:SGNH/GDSL hydrolase family protein n=1 Tax=Clostridium sp. C2-6-12 TaxID=2698832 RepID=UPI001367A5FE|nr:SGNH/GDSL hydrolase family protein [Clostridium sp. C2-6-12]